MWSKRQVEERIQGSPGDRQRPGVGPSIKGRPFRVVAFEASLRFDPAMTQVRVANPGRFEKGKRVRVDLGRVGIAIGVAIGMMLAVEYRVSPGRQKRGSLKYERAEIEEALPASAYRKLPVRSVAMKKERLAENRKRPVENEKGSDSNHIGLPCISTLLPLDVAIGSGSCHELVIVFQAVR